MMANVLNKLHFLCISVSTMIKSRMTRYLTRTPSQWKHSVAIAISPLIPCASLLWGILLSVLLSLNYMSALKHTQLSHYVSALKHTQLSHYVSALKHTQLSQYMLPTCGLSKKIRTVRLENVVVWTCLTATRLGVSTKCISSPAIAAKTSNCL